ncbi:ESX secretion-associated protein EspG [Nocardia carnea]|uniref:ESX secretion-associated protein EspG n=1 Tax=Nocardia carnea TaxID=37328 RepID=A0ABW7TQW6_9NOCA|nr:ESX secretion-associated protein EspG [Nocardia carnea]
MIRTWELTDLEFVVLCEEFRQGGLPDPFTFTSRTRLAADYRKEKAETLRALRDRDDSDLYAMADAIARPDVTILATVWDEQAIEEPASWIRVHAVRQRARGFVVNQRPGETVWHSGGFDVTACDPHDLADSVLALLPEAGAGRLPQITLIDSEALPDARPYVPMISDDDEPEDDEAYRSAAFLATPATATGTVQVFQGRSMFGPRGRVDMGLRWRDLPDDGRYVIPMNQEVEVATGMGTKRMIEWTHEQIAEVLLRLDRNLEHEE